MQLGERIYRLRTAQNLSQGDLAELLNVSRQSISKWENNNATPDLDKLLRLSEVFGISLDELVKGEATASRVTDGAAAASTTDGRSGYRTAGIVLFGLSAFIMLLLTVMGGFAAGLIFASPFLVCGVICMVCKRNAGLWCAWAAAIMVDLYLRYATGLRWGTILHTFRWTPQMNYMRLFIAWMQFLVILVLTCTTAVRLKDQRSADRRRLFIRWGAVVLLSLALWGMGQLLAVMIGKAGGSISTMETSYIMFNLVQNLFDWARILAFTAALAETLRHVKRKKCKKDL